jgi:hypothetical protein
MSDSKRALILGLIGGIALSIVAGPAFAQDAAATDIKNRLQALAMPVLLIGIVWMGYLMMARKLDKFQALLFFFGFLIVIGGGFINIQR